MVPQPARTIPHTAGPTRSGPTLPGPISYGLSQAGPIQTQLFTAADQWRNNPNEPRRDRRDLSGNNRNTDRNQEDRLTGFQRNHRVWYQNAPLGPAQQPSVSIKHLSQTVAATAASTARLPTVSTNDSIEVLRKQIEDLRVAMRQFVNQVQDVRDQLWESLVDDDAADESGDEEYDYNQEYEEELLDDNVPYDQSPRDPPAPPRNQSVPPSNQPVLQPNSTVWRQNPSNSQSSSVPQPDAV